MFTQDFIVNYIRTGAHVKLIESITEVLKRIDSLKDGQVSGLLTAAFTLGHTVWTDATKALSLMEEKTRKQTLTEF